MISKAPLLLVAGALWVAGAPTQETYYQILAPDQTTVLCDSRTPGSCAPVFPNHEVVFGGGSELFARPERHSFNTSLVVGVRGDITESTDNYFRLRHFFEEEIDFGWYAFAGGTGDFWAEYGTGISSTDTSRIELFWLPISPFPIEIEPPPGCCVYRRETFGRPFRVNVGFRVVLDEVLLGFYDLTTCCDSGFIGVHLGTAVSGRGFALDDINREFPFEVQLVPVTPIPEPGGLSLFGLCAILGAGVVRRYRVT